MHGIIALTSAVLLYICLSIHVHAKVLHSDGMCTYYNNFACITVSMCMHAMQTIIMQCLTAVM